MNTTQAASRKRDQGRLPAELPPEGVVVKVDSREQFPADVSPLRHVVGTWQTGDYGLLHLPDAARIELKTLDDYLSCLGQQRDRFEREIERLMAFPTRLLILKTTWPELEAGRWRSRITAKAAVGSTLGWIAKGLPVALVGDHARAGRIIARVLYTVARRNWSALRQFANSIVQPEEHEET